MKTCTITDANVYVDGTSAHGQATEVTLPDIANAKVDYKALGMVGTSKIFTGFDALEATIKWSAAEAEVLKAIADPFAIVALMIRSSRAVYENGSLSEEQPVVYHIKAKIGSLNLGSLKKGDLNEQETKLDVSYIQLIQNGEEVFELDVDNNIYVVGGVDKLAAYRDNLGL